MTVTRRPTLLKTEQEYKSILTRSSDRAVSLPVERKSYVQDYPPGEKERGYSVQRDQVRFDNILLIYNIKRYILIIIISFFPIEWWCIISMIVSGFNKTLA